MNIRGQALIETSAFFLALAILLGGFVGVTRWFAIRQKLMLVAKEGALLYSSGHWTRREVEARMRTSLSNRPIALDPQRVRVSVGPRPGFKSWTFELDESVAGYVVPPLWRALWGEDAFQEKFIVKHAPRYWAPVQPWGGPPISYGK